MTANTFIRRPVKEETTGRFHGRFEHSFWQKFSRIIIYLILFFALFGVFIYVLPRANVTIVTEKREISGSFEVTVDTTVSESDASAGILPALHYGKTLKRDEIFPTTGSIDIGKRSQGRALFSNRTGLDWPLLTEHKIRGGDNKLYRVLSDAVIPKATVSSDGMIVPGEIQVDLEADSGGDAYNLPEGKILALLTVPQDKQDKIFGYVIKAFTGGTTQVVESLSVRDSTEAEQLILSKAKTAVLEEFLPRFGDEYEVFDQLLFVLRASTSTLPAVSEPAQEFSMSLDVEFGGIAIKKKLLEEAVSQELKRKEPLLAGETLSQDISFSFTSINKINQDGYSAKAKVEYRAYAVPDLPIEEFREAILGKKENKARLYLLSQKGVKDVRFDYKWNLLSSIPDNPKKVAIKVE